jgi:hypothetical protein
MRGHELFEPKLLLTSFLLFVDVTPSHALCHSALNTIVVDCHELLPTQAENVTYVL